MVEYEMRCLKPKLFNEMNQWKKTCNRMNLNCELGKSSNYLNLKYIK